MQIRAARNIEIMRIRFMNVFTKFICLNDFYPLFLCLRGAVALWLKRLSCKQGIRGSNLGRGNIEVMQLRIVTMFTKFICQNDFRPLSTFIRSAVA